MSFSKRIKEYIVHKGFSTRMFEKACGINIGTLARVIDKNSSIQSNNLEKIIASFPDLNLDWLLTGKGVMLNSDNSSTSNEDYSRILDKQSWYDEELERANKEIEWQRKQIDLLTSIIKRQTDQDKDTEK